MTPPLLERVATPTAVPANSDGVGRQQVLDQRLRAAAPALLRSSASGTADGVATADLLDRLVRAVQSEPTPERLWLLQVATSGRYPDSDDAVAARRAAELRDPAEFALWLLDDAREAAFRDGTGCAPIEVVTDAVLVDVDYTAQHDLHSGIQRVVRSTLPHWMARRVGHRPVVPVVWVDGHRILRRLAPGELGRVLRWGDVRPDVSRDADVRADLPLVVPWYSTVVVMEVPWRPACERFAALARFSGSRVAAVGYDCIPVVSAPSVPITEPNRFIHYLTMIKHAHVVAAISVSAAQEFAGFKQMLPTQGLTGPRVVECPLPVDRPSTGTTDPAVTVTPGDGNDPLVTCVGSFEPRKNQLAVLAAAELLWREGLRFRLRFIGASGWGRELPRLIARLRRRGRAVEQLTAVSEAELDCSYRDARFSVFVSTHEGYGLPVAESLARGVPVLTSNYGSTAEIAAGGGALTVDPRDVDAITGAMRRLLVDDDLATRLRDEIAARPHSSWHDYSTRLWDALDLDRTGVDA